MKKLLFLLIAIGLGCSVQSQTRVEKTIAVRSGQKVEMYFKRPELITIKTWDKSEIQVVGNVSINNGANDDAFEIISTDDEVLSIKSAIKNYNDLPRNLVIRYKGEDYFFNTNNPNAPEVVKFKSEMDGGYDYMRNGVITDITLEIMVPKNIDLEIESKFGLVEVYGFTNKLEVISKFGGIDASIDPQRSASLNVRTKFGEVYSNLDMEFSSRDRYDIGRWVTLEGKGNTSDTHYFKSEFGNVYLRKM